MKTLIAATSALLICAGGAFAQGNQSSASSNSTSGSGTTNMSIRQQITDGLKKDGYSDISVMPVSFVVHAKDKSGQPTAIVIGPDSAFAVTDVSGGNGGGSSSSSQQGGQQK